MDPGDLESAATRAEVVLTDVAPRFYGTVSDDGTLTLRNRAQWDAYTRRFAGQDVELTIRKRRQQRSLRQNAYWWAVPVPLMADYMGQGLEETKLDLLGECFGWQETSLGNKVPRKPSTAALTVEEFSALITWLIPWALTEHGVRIPLPDEVEVNA